MFLRKLSLFLALVMLFTLPVATAEGAVDVILATGTTQAFTDAPVAEADLNAILLAGLNATSAINQQPWFFAVVTNADLMAEIGASSGFSGAPAGAPAGKGASSGAPAAPAASGTAKAALGDSPVAVIIFMDTNTMSPDASFDCGLACQNMVIAASALGYGTKIISSPTNALNGANHDALCAKLGVDPALTAVAVLLIGQADVDAVATASVRKTIEEKVSFAK